MSKKILLFANTDWYLYNFRLSLIKTLSEKGWDVILISPAGKYGPILQSLGFKWISLQFSTRSVNPFQELKVLLQLFKLYRHEQPDICHHFTIKCVLYGSLVARLVGGIKIVNAVTGLGHIFIDTGMIARIFRPFIKMFYKQMLKQQNCRVIFQNNEDLNFFVETKLVDKAKTKLIRGSGVDSSKFSPENFLPFSQENFVKILFASRLIKEKGIYELFEAIRFIRNKKLEVNFILAGDIYPSNPSSLSGDEIRNIKREGLIDVLGHVDDMLPVLAESDMVVLPSYCEGTPRILIEAAAMEKPIVATDIAGCRGLVENGVNGLLVPVKDVMALVEALEKLIMDSELRIKFGKAGREIVLKEFDEKIVLKKTFAVYEELMEKK